MSEENVELARRAFAAWAGRDVEALLEMADEDVEFASALGATEGRTYRGHSGAAQYFADIDAAWDYWQISEPEFIPAGDEQVVCIFTIRAKGRGSGIPLEQRVASIWTLRNGRAIRGVIYLNPTEALEAAGLSE